MTKYDEAGSAIPDSDGPSKSVGFDAFTEVDRLLLTELHATVMELKTIVAQAEPFLDSFLGGSGAPKSPMNAIFGALMGGK